MEPLKPTGTTLDLNLLWSENHDGICIGQFRAQGCIRTLFSYSDFE